MDVDEWVEKLREFVQEMADKHARGELSDKENRLIANVIEAIRYTQRSGERIENKPSRHKIAIVPDDTWIVDVPPQWKPPDYMDIGGYDCIELTDHDGIVAAQFGDGWYVWSSHYETLASRLDIIDNDANNQR